ncbi:tRNA-binding protein [Candidatus Woesearchaeota archaeon]|jgi:tRNA-binding protein|nr:tRNA-binding protein [Candidatus Woesearchaeota archaeon]|tara:strand:+ start:5090 stop:5425 length:336 start_codon:yes stop_codon:yes gene_type:complete
MSTVTFDDWKKFDLKVGEVLEVARVPKTEKLYKLQVDIGTDKPIQIVTSLVPYYSEEELKGKKIVVLVNLEKAKFGGEISEGMLLCAETEDESKCVLLTPHKDIEAGTPIM